MKLAQSVLKDIESRWENTDILGRGKLVNGTNLRRSPSVLSTCRWAQLSKAEQEALVLAHFQVTKEDLLSFGQNYWDASTPRMRGKMVNNTDIKRAVGIITVMSWGELSETEQKQIYLTNCQ